MWGDTGKLFSGNAGNVRPEKIVTSPNFIRRLKDESCEVVLYRPLTEFPIIPAISKGALFFRTGISSKNNKSSHLQIVTSFISRFPRFIAQLLLLPWLFFYTWKFANTALIQLRLILRVLAEPGGNGPLCFVRPQRLGSWW